MKKSIVIPGALLLVVNILAGLILTKYAWFNVIMSSCVIILTTIFLSVLCLSNVRSAYRISLISLFIFNGFVSFVLSLFSKSAFQDNWCLVVIILLFLIQSIVWIICNAMTNRIKQ